MKQDLLTQLQDKQVSYSDNQKLLDDLITRNQVVFDIFNDQIYAKFQPEHYWNAAYFSEQIQDLPRNFSQERCQHIIEIKEKLQNRGEKGFLLKSQSENDKVKTEDNKKPDLSGFKPAESLLSYLDGNNIMQIRAELESYLNDMDLYLIDLINNIYFVYEKYPHIYEEYRTASLIKDINLKEEDWNWEYFNLQQVYLNRNFSLERLLHLVNVREKLAEKGVKEFQPVFKNNKSSVEPPKEDIHHQAGKHNRQQENPIPRMQSSSKQDDHFIKTALLIGGAILTVVAVLFSIYK